MCTSWAKEIVTVGRVIALHIANPVLISGTKYGPVSLPGIIPEYIQV